MAAALIKFSQVTQGTGGNGLAFVGVLGQLVTVSNSDNTGVASWQIDLVYSDPSSSVTPATPFAFNNNGSNPSATFTPDVSRSFRFVLKVWSVTGRAGDPDDTDIRVFTVKEGNAIIIPPSQIWPRPLPPPPSGETGNKPNELNFGGQPDGWAGSGTSDGLLNDTLTKVLFASPQIKYVERDTLVPSSRQTGSQALPYRDIQFALDDIYNAAVDTSWVIYVAAGDYEDELHFPPERKIALIGPDYGLVNINTNSLQDANWEVRGTSYLAFKNVAIHHLSASASGSNPPDIATLYLENVSYQILDTSSVTCNVVAVGPNTYLESASLTGRLAVDGIDHLTDATCGSFAIYDTLITGGGEIVVQTGDGIATNCQIDIGVTFTFSGYAAKFYVDAMTKYWIDQNSISVTGATVVLMGPAAIVDNAPVIYVNPTSTASLHDGTVTRPYLTLAAGLAAATALRTYGYGEITVSTHPGDYTSEGALTWSSTSSYPALNIVSGSGGLLYTGSTAGVGGLGSTILHSLNISSAYVRLVGISISLGNLTINSSSTLEAYRSDFNFTYPSNMQTAGPARLTECTVYSNATNFVQNFWAIRCEFPDGIFINCSTTRVNLISCTSGGDNTITFSGSAGVVNLDDFTYRSWDPVHSTVSNGSLSIYGYFGMERSVGPITTTSTGGPQTIGNANMSLFGGSNCQIVGKVWISSRQMTGSEFGGLIEKTFCLRRVSGTLALSASGADVVTAASGQPAGTITLSISGTSLNVACTPSSAGSTKWLGKVRVETMHNLA